MNEIGL